MGVVKVTVVLANSALGCIVGQTVDTRVGASAVGDDVARHASNILHSMEIRRKHEQQRQYH